MKITANEKLENSRIALTIVAESEEFEPNIERAYKKNVARMSVPGFRKGKAPRKMLEKIYGEGVFFEDAVNMTYPELYRKALEETGYEPVDQADIELDNIEEGGFSFKATFTVSPEVTLGQYKGLSAEEPAVAVEAEEVEAEITRLRERNASLQDVERPVQDGDTITFDYEGFKDNVPFDGGKAEGAKLVIGSGRFIPGFEEALIGKGIGQELSIDLTFPEEYHAEELAGAPVVFKCIIHEIKEKLLPELDDEFAKDVSEFETLAELRRSIEDRILDTRRSEAENAFETALVTQVIENMTAEIPEVMVESQLEDMIQDIRYRLSGQRMDLETYLMMTGSSLEQLKEERRPDALRQVQATLAFRAIADAEDFVITDEDVSAEYQRLAELYSMDVDKIKLSLSERVLRRDLRALRASELVKSTATKTAAAG